MNPLSGWQRANVLAAAQFLREVLSRAPADSKAQLVYDGLLEVLEPARRVIRQQREVAAARAAVPIREQRSGADRRTGRDRRAAAPAVPATGERRKAERRKGDRRRRS
jgi:hypothetical protein